MKKVSWVLAFVGLMAAGVVSAVVVGKAPLNMTVGSSARIVLAGVAQTNTPQWAVSNAMTTVDAFCSTNGFVYQVVSTGTTAAVAPTFTDGEASNGTVVLRFVHKERNGFTLINVGTGKVYVAYGKTPVVNKGLVLYPNGAGILSGGEKCYQGDVWAISGAGDANVLTVHQE
jgi:hypothetical protein